MAGIPGKLGFNWLDELTTRLALWGFYDGLYDYGSAQFAERAAQSKFHYDAAGTPFPHGGFQTEGYSVKQAISGNGARRDVRDIYGRRIRVNEAYVSIASGPLFVRIGRQAISWGESDTIGLLDANNPFDSTIVPGIFLDIDEARIPLWTVRATYQLFSQIGPFSSGFLDTYFVPGMIDTTISPLQVQSVSPYSAPPPASPANLQETFALLPDYKFGSSRWGVRFQTVIARNFTTSVWFYKTFQGQPSPRIAGASTANPSHGLVVVAEAPLENVAGISTTFFSEPLNSIVRAEVEVFNNEAGFRAATNFAPLVSGAPAGYSDKINLVKGELGVDRNFFVVPLNPTTSFTSVTAFVFSANPDETQFKDYRAGGILKPSAIARQARNGLIAGSVVGGCDGKNTQLGCDFVNQSAFEYFFQQHLETQYMHGSLTPAVTAIINGDGALVLIPDLSYRVTDNLTLSSRYVNIHTFGSQNNGFYGPGFFRDRDQVWLRASMQLN